VASARSALSPKGVIETPHRRGIVDSSSSTSPDRIRGLPTLCVTGSGWDMQQRIAILEELVRAHRGTNSAIAELELAIKILKQEPHQLPVLQESINSATSALLACSEQVRTKVHSYRDVPTREYSY
jgi:hypothetical protein